VLASLGPAAVVVIAAQKSLQVAKWSEELVHAIRTKSRLERSAGHAGAERPDGLRRRPDENI